MKAYKHLLIIIIAGICFYSQSLFSQEKLIADPKYTSVVNEKFTGLNKRLPVYYSNSIFKIDSMLSGQKKEAYRFLFAFMPLCDIAEQPAGFYKEIVDITFEGKELFSWGKTIPNEVFIHFVLPYRVNNENLDTSRVFFYHQIKDRIKNMTMLDAAMEVNHWCHEHVAYQASDERTSAPHATYKNGLGRCGEESTFTVAALRSVGIPARQVYTPRWAHTDDNHAWVEFWADGKWYYFGACEPEPEPNMGWFSEPSRRAMLVNTRVSGNYNGNETILESYSNYSVLNTLDVYAKTKTIYVKTLNENSSPAKDAIVEFQLYNYAEYYPLTQQKSDNNGITSFKTGLGSLMIWAYSNDRFAWKTIDVSSVDTIVLKLDKTFEKGVFNFDNNAPLLLAPIPRDPKGKELNQKRLHYEDSLRAAWEATFADSLLIAKVAFDNNLKYDAIRDIIVKSRANYSEIISFINLTPSGKKETGVSLLKALPEKDLHDTKCEILLNHINTPSFAESKITDEKIYQKYLLNPHISNELLTPWRGKIKAFFSGKKITDGIIAAQWVDLNIKLIEKNEYDRVPISPIGVLLLTSADKHSREILQIAILRDFGIAARFETGTMKIQYYADGAFHYLSATSEIKKGVSQAFLTLKDVRKNQDFQLKYYKHFTIAKLDKGVYNTLEFEEDRELKNFDSKTALSPGFYRLTTGNRQPSGNTLVQFTYFELKEGETFVLDVNLRGNTTESTVYGNCKTLEKMDTYSETGKIPDKPAYTVLCWINPNGEPSRHCLQDISALNESFAPKNMIFKIITQQKLDIEKLDPKYFGNLPKPHTYNTDPENMQLHQIESILKTKCENNLPLIVVYNENFEIIYYSTGYKIGTGEEILRNCR